MKLARLEVENVTGIPDGSYDFIRPAGGPDDRLTAIVGPRGAGKTQLLEAIVFAKEQIGAYGPPSRPSALLRAGTSSGRLRAAFRLDEAEQASAEADDATIDVAIDLADGASPVEVPRGVRALFAGFSVDPRQSKLEYFPDNRQLDAQGDAIDVEQEKRLRPTRSPRKYAGLVAAIAARSTLDGARALQETGRSGLLFADDAPDSLGPYRYALGSLCPEVHLVGALPHAGAPRLMFALKSGATVAADALSGAQKQALLFAGTIVSLGLAKSLILIDVPESGLHVADQDPFFRALVALAPNAQLVVATGSSAVAQCVKREQTLYLTPPR